MVERQSQQLGALGRNQYLRSCARRPSQKPISCGSGTDCSLPQQFEPYLPFVRKGSHPPNTIHLRLRVLTLLLIPAATA